MPEKDKNIECKKVNCQRKAFFVESLPNGELLLCLVSRHDGEKHVYKLTWEEVKKIYKK